MMNSSVDPNEKDPVKAKVDRVAGYAALREMATLARQIKHEEARDRAWVKRAIQIGGAVIALLLIALLMPGGIKSLLRGIAGLLH